MSGSESGRVHMCMCWTLAEGTWITIDLWDAFIFEWPLRCHFRFTATPPPHTLQQNGELCHVMLKNCKHIQSTFSSLKEWLVIMWFYGPLDVWTEMWNRLNLNEFIISVKKYPLKGFLSLSTISHRWTVHAERVTDETLTLARLRISTLNRRKSIFCSLLSCKTCNIEKTLKHLRPFVRAFYAFKG